MEASPNIADPLEPPEPASAARRSDHETRDDKIARYGCDEFTLKLTEAFHQAKRLGIQADREAAKRRSDP